jgi:eukaryotic-like serine/threonine-protein kinase
LSIRAKLEAAMFVASPDRLGKYPLLGIIGTGSTAVVYKSIDPEIGRVVALKTIRRELLDDEIENFPARFRIEAETAAALAHPCIVRTYEHGEADGYTYIVMEYVEGHSLRDCFESQVRFNAEQAINIVSQLLKALQYAHEHGVWHRDVKPANILLVTDGLIKVTDFGIARVESLNLAQTDSIMGTPGFIAPEMYLGEAFDQRIDLFAAGVVFYQLLTGVAPFVGTPEKIMFKVCYETPLPASVVTRQGSLRPFDAVVEKALARRPEDRFSSAADFLEALSLAQAGGPVGTDATVIVARRLLQPGGSAGSNETLIVPRRPVQADGSAGANETVVIPRRPTGAAGRAVADETLLVPRRSEPDNSDYTLIRPVSTGQSHPLTEPLPPPPVLEPGREAVERVPDARRVPERDAAGEGEGDRDREGHPTSQLQATDMPSQEPGWTRAELTQIEKHLARFVGPIAGVWVRSGARETGDLVALVQCLAAKFSDAADRDAFLRSFGVTSGPAPTRGDPGAGIDACGTGADGGVPLTPEYIERAARLLAVHMGPIATVLAKRAAQPGSSQEQFVGALASHLSDDGERAKFLRTLRS